MELLPGASSHLLLEQFEDFMSHQHAWNKVFYSMTNKEKAGVIVQNEGDRPFLVLANNEPVGEITAEERMDPVRHPDNFIDDPLEPEDQNGMFTPSRIVTYESRNKKFRSNMLVNVADAYRDRLICWRRCCLRILCGIHNVKDPRIPFLNYEEDDEEINNKIKACDDFIQKCEVYRGHRRNAKPVYINLLYYYFRNDREGVEEVFRELSLQTYQRNSQNDWSKSDSMESWMTDPKKFEELFTDFGGERKFLSASRALRASFEKLKRLTSSHFEHNTLHFFNGRQERPLSGFGIPTLFI